MWKHKKVVWEGGTFSAFSLKSGTVTSLAVTACLPEATSVVGCGAQCRVPSCAVSIYPTALHLYARVRNRSMVVGFESEEQLRDWEQLVSSHVAGL